MQLVVVPILIIVGAVIFFYAGDILSGVNLSLGDSFELRGLKQSPKPHEPVSSNGAAIAPRPTLAQPASFALDTTITTGPLNNSVLSDNNQATFTFSGSIFPASTEGAIGFETKVEGLDQNWVAARGNSRTITFPSDPREYTFYARSTLKGFVDATPATRVIRVNTSPYFGKVHISRVSAPGFLQITNNLPDGEEVAITGWKFKATTDTYTIPQAVADLSSANFSAAQRKNIVMRRGTTVVISSAHNPLANNMPYRPNQCFGEFKKGRDFPLHVPGNCIQVPKPALKEISSLRVSCQDYILRNVGGSCAFPEFEKVHIVTSDSTCFLHLRQLEERFQATSGYEYCYQQHFFEPTFFSNEWHIYTGGETFLRAGHDRVTLHDENDLIVDEHLY